jgi:hypothetical protein
MVTFKIKHHKGRSGKSVFEYRVYEIITPSSPSAPQRTTTLQLAKCKTLEAAEAFLARCEAL